MLDWKEPPDLLITEATILPLAPELPALIAPGYLAAAAGRISAVGSMADLAGRQLPACRRIEARGRLLLPGLINTHTHGAMSLFRGLADDLPLMTWLTEHIFPAEARWVDPDFVYWGSRLAALEMLTGGTTTAADGYFLEDRAAAAFRDSGLRAVAAQGIIDFPAPGVPDPARNVEAAAELVSQWQGRSERITPAVFCHAPYTCSAATLVRAKEMARDLGVRFFIHVAETRDEVEEMRKRHGATPVAYLDGLGLLDPETVCVHCVWLEPDDLEILARAGARVSHCPESNMKLGAGIAPVGAMLARGIAVGLGTDGAASNNDLDLFREMDSCAKLHKVKDLDPTALPAAEVLALATSGAARVLGREGALGRLSPGYLADCILVGCDRAHLVPLYRPESHLVYAATGADVETVIVGGEVVMEDRRILLFDPAEVLARAREFANKIRG